MLSLKSHTDPVWSSFAGLKIANSMYTRALLQMCMTFAWNAPLTPRPAKIPATTKIIAYDTIDAWQWPSKKLLFDKRWFLIYKLKSSYHYLWPKNKNHLNSIQQRMLQFHLTIFSKIPCYTYFVRQKEQSPYNVPKCLWDQIEWLPTFFWHISRQKYCWCNCTLNYKFLVNH